jgi:N-acetylneuraminic acid mutarotase
VSLIFYLYVKCHCYCFSLKVYEEHQNAWHEAPSMNKHRGHHGVVAVGGAIYAIGGTSK